ncbi:MAG TPA: PIN domain-containing protein [Bryobacteraceae bacterium]|nr:PIN domain-containing protein [Bryobacteraceae bacterium]
MSIFVDTSGLYAVFDRDDANHSKARVAWEEWLRQDEPLITNNYVILETLALLQRRIGVAAVRMFQEDVAPLLQVDWVSEGQHSAAVEAMLAAARRKLSVVDCVSFQTMRRHGLRTAFCFDPHFREQGFSTKP